MLHHIKAIMKEIQNISCSCSGTDGVDSAKSGTKKIVYQLLIGSVGVGLWFIIYLQLSAVAAFLTYDVFSLERGSRLGEAVHFFLYDTPKCLCC